MHLPTTVEPFLCSLPIKSPNNGHIEASHFREVSTKFSFGTLKLARFFLEVISIVSFILSVLP